MSDARGAAPAVFRKARTGAPDGFFACEAAGLAWLAEPAGGPRVARVLDVGADHLDLERVTAAPATAAAPIAGRLPLSRSPVAPKTTTSRPAVVGRSAASASSRASVLCAKSTTTRGDAASPAPTTSMRPGTTADRPPAASSASCTSCRCAPPSSTMTSASAALATLKSPGSDVVVRTARPSAWVTVNADPVPCGTTSETVQSAAAAPLPSSPAGRVRSVATGTWAARAMRSPHASSTTTTPRRACSGVNSRALVSKYVCRSPWKSRWSWLRLVKPTTPYWTPSTRCRASACDDTSIARVRTPSSSIAASRACRSAASGVVSRDGSTRSPERISTVPTSPPFQPSARSTWSTW